MDKSHSSANFVDLTEDDDDGVLPAGPGLSEPTNSWHAFANSPSRPNCLPFVLDLTGDGEEGAQEKNNIITNGNAGGASRNSAYAFFNRQTLESSAQKEAEKAASAQPSATRDTSRYSRYSANNLKDWQEYRNSDPTYFASTGQRMTASSHQSISRPSAATHFPMPRPKPYKPHVKRKQPSLSKSSERPVFKSPPKTTWQDAGAAKKASSPTTHDPKPQPHPVLAERPKTVSQSPPRPSPSSRSARMPQSRVFTKFDEIFLAKTAEASRSSRPRRDSPALQPDRMEETPAAGHAYSHHPAESQEMAEASRSSRLRRNSPAAQPDRLEDTPAPGHAYTHQTTESQEDDLEEDPELPVSPTSFFAPDFDRGRLPQQRRRRGDMGVPDPYHFVARARDKTLGEIALENGLINQAELQNGRVSYAPASRNALSAGKSRSSLASQRHASYLGATSKVKSGQTIPTFPNLKPIPATQNILFPNLNPTPATHEILNSVDEHVAPRQWHPPLNLANRKSPAVPVKHEDSDDDGNPNSLPDYLDTTRRTRGWHHDGYVDVKDLFHRIAMDAVHRKRGEFEEWPLELNITTQKVREKDEDFAKQKFGFFVRRLAMTPRGSSPNQNDVDWIQRKVSETFLAEALRATENVRHSQPDSTRGEEIMATHQTEPLRQVSGESMTSDFDNRRTRSQGSVPSEQLVSTSMSRTSSTLSDEPSPLENQHQTIAPRVSRPSRAAAGAAASRITSQYTIYGRPGAVYERQLCKYCDCMISVNNWGVHIDTIKHKNNVAQAKLKANVEHTLEKSPLRTVHERRYCEYCDCMISVATSVTNWDIHIATLKHRHNVAKTTSKANVEHSRGKHRPSRNLEKYRLENDLRYRQDNTAPETLQDAEYGSARLTCPPTIPADKLVRTVRLQPQSKTVQDPRLQSLAASLASLERDVLRPYQGTKKRGTVDKEARLDMLTMHHLLRHVGFAANEMAMIRKFLVRDRYGAVDVHESLRNAYTSGTFNDRERSVLAIRSKVQTLEQNQQNEPATFDVIESCIKDPNVRPARHIGSLLRHRELGSSSIGRNVETRSELKSRLAEAIKPWRSFKGASHDVVTVAWAPNSMGFAAGAAAHSNSEDLQYNRPCNLLLGDLFRNTLTEFPDHCVDRQKLNQGLNASQDMFNACDPKVYKTVFSVNFHPSGHQMYTASEDQTVKIWDLSQSGPRCFRTIKHDASVTGLDLSPADPGVIATASQNVKNAIQVFTESNGARPLAQFSSTRALMRPEWQLYPESLSWGPSAATGHLLLAGFNACRPDGEMTHEGHLCLWDAITGQDLKPLPSSQAIHTAAWHPRMPFFATGGAPGFEKTNRLTTKTVVRAWDYRHIKRLAVEYECPAREMTDVTFHPLDQNIATAGCTDAVSYVWDFRWPDEPLHQLRHGKSIMPTGEKDTGVMMSLWGPGNSLYYTGSSDGEIRAWDIRRHPNDVLVNTVAQLGAGIQSGAFSPDGTHLLIGDATGGIHVLSSAPWAPGPDPAVDDDIGTSGTPMTIIRANDDGDDDGPETQGIEAARELVRSGQISIDPVYGPGKGPSYNGPWGTDYREPAPGNTVGRLKKETYKEQPFSRSGEERPEHATPIRVLAAARKELLGTSCRDDDNTSRTTSLAPETPKSLVVEEHSEQDLSPILSPGLRGLGKLDDSIALACPTRRADITTPGSRIPDIESETLSTGSPTWSSQSSILETDIIDNIIPESELLEENDWWPRLGEEEIAQARARPNLRHD